MTRKTGWPVRVKLPTLPAEWQAGDAVREARPVRTIDLSDRTDWVFAPLAGRQLPPALVSGGVSRCPVPRLRQLSRERGPYVAALVPQDTKGAGHGSGQEG